MNKSTIYLCDIICTSGSDDVCLFVFIPKAPAYLVPDLGRPQGGVQGLHVSSLFHYLSGVRTVSRSLCKTSGHVIFQHAAIARDQMVIIQTGGGYHTAHVAQIHPILT